MNPPASTIRKRYFAANTGKARFEFDQIAFDTQVGLVEKMVYVTTREEVEKCDVSQFLATFGGNDYNRLQELHGQVRFAIAGYDDDPDPLFAIPAVRRFYLACHQRWPAWSFFGDLQSDCLAMVACCIIPNLCSANRNNHQLVIVSLQHTDLLSFFEEGLPPAALLHAKMGIDKLAGVKLLQKVLLYLDLPDKGDEVPTVTRPTR